MRSPAKCLLVAALLLLGGSCGTNVATFPAQILGADGTPIYLEELRAIVDDVALSADEQRQGIRDLGIEDEELITAILGE